ncbi:vgr related protein [Novosphingobium sp.]|uniref:vgr related protein n=1 Tax=Novosphingobium sp. TaxID=1874826 RepID=UPI0038B7D9EA
MTTPAGGERPLSASEVDLVGSVFGDGVDCAPVRLRRRRFMPFQPAHTVMAPMGHIHFHPASPHWREDFAVAPVGLQGLFIHEMTHVWQAQRRGRWYLPLRRHPFCRYAYRLRPGWRLTDYGLEQQAEIVAHAFLARIGAFTPEDGQAPLLEQLALSVRYLDQQRTRYSRPRSLRR